MLIRGIKKFLPNSLGIRFWKFCSDLEIAWLASIMRGCLILKIIKRIKLFMRFNFVYKTNGIYSTSCQPTQKMKIEFSVSSSQEIGSSLVSFEMIFEALQSEIFRFKFRLLSSEIVKIPEFTLRMLSFDLNLWMCVIQCWQLCCVTLCYVSIPLVSPFLIS